MTTPPSTARRSTSALMRSRAATPKLPAPESSRRSAGVVAAATLANASRIVARACCWPLRSAPSARVLMTSTARGATRETQTPFSTFGARAGSSASAMRIVSPVGSRNSTGLISDPAGVPSNARLSSIAARSPSALKRAASTAGLSA